MTTGSNKAVVQSYYRCINAGDFIALEPLLSEDHRRFLLSTREWWTKQRFLEVEKEAGIGGGLFREPLRIEIDVMTAEEDRVAVLARGRAVTQDGVLYDQLYHNLFIVRGGKIVEVHEFNDTRHIFDVIRRGPGGSVGLPEHRG